MERPPTAATSPARLARRRAAAGLLASLPVALAVGGIVVAAHLADTPAPVAPVRVAGISVERPATLGAASPSAADPRAAARASAAFVAAMSDADLRLALVERLGFDWTRLPGWRMRVEPPRDGFRGVTRPDERMILVYRFDGSTFDDYVHVAAHELGHAVDVTLLDDRDRARWLVARGLASGGSKNVTWWVSSGADDFSSGAGDWAESFAWARAPGSFASRLGPPPDPAQVALIGRLTGEAPVSAGSG